MMGATFALLLATLQAFPPLLGPAGEFGKFMDETQSAQVALNFLTHLHYSIDLWKPYAGAFYPEMSIGLLSSWPAAVGWGLGGDLLASRLATILYCLALWLVVGTVAARTVLAVDRAPAFVISCLTCALALLLVPGAADVVVHAQGEFSGAGWLGLGCVLSIARPRTAALVLGLCVWHTKFIFLPFVLLAMVWSACTHERTPIRRAKLLAVELALFMLPLVAWMVVIASQIGAGGLAEWAARRVGWYGRGNSGLSGAPTVQGLRNRLAAPNLEWSGYSLATKVRILTLLFAPCALLLGATARRRLAGERRRALDLLQAALVAIQLAFAWWYFYWNEFMWVRHLEPALLVGFAVLAYFATRAAVRLPEKRQAWIATAACAVAIVAALGRMSDTAAAIRAWPLTGSVARACRSGVPWQMGPWPRCMRLSATIIRPAAPPTTPPGSAR